MIISRFKLFFYWYDWQYDLTPYVLSVEKTSEINRGKQVLNIELDLTKKEEYLQKLSPFLMIEFFKEPNFDVPYFQGWIEKVVPSVEGNIKTISVRAIDASGFLDGIIISEEFEETDTRTVLVYLIQDYQGGRLYNDFHFRIGNIEKGKKITKIFNHCTFLEVLNFLADVNSFVWEIKPIGKYPNVEQSINLFSPYLQAVEKVYTTEKTNFNIRRGSINYDDGMTSFFNAIWLFGGKTKSTLFVEKFKYYSYMGLEKVFNLAYEPYFDIGSDGKGINGTYVKVAGISRTIGVDRKEEEREVLYNSKEKIIKLMFEPPDYSDVEVSYYTYVPLTIYEEDRKSIRKYYKRERVITRSDITERNMGRDYCKLLLQQYANPIQKLSFDIERDADIPEVGEGVKIQIPELGLDTMMVLKRKTENWKLPYFCEVSLDFEDIRENLESKIRELEERIKRLEDKERVDTLLDRYMFEEEGIEISESFQTFVNTDIWWKVGDKVGFGEIY